MWLLSAEVREIFAQLLRSGVSLTEEQQSKFEARYHGSDEDGNARNRLLTVVDDKAEILVKGVLTKSPNWMAMFFGGGNTTYPDIASALAEADQNEKVTSATLKIDSPGGQFEGLFDALSAVELFSKPLKASVTGMATSAAYAIAAKADSIEAANKAVLIGSIGVAAAIGVNDHEVVVTSTAAPKKRPDVTTEEGKAMVREELDAMHDIFAEAIATGRQTTVKNINTTYGQGATLLAEAALNRGMIDSIAGVSSLKLVRPAAQTTASGGTKPETGTMDIQTLKAQHPAVYAAAVQLGVDQEHDRVCSHITLGEASGDLKTALAAVDSGAEMNDKIRAQYLAASMNRADTTARTDDDGDAAAAADNVDDSDVNASDNAVADLVCERLGFEE
ncbi:MAG: hypothetical protein GY811_05190 [Myxococcales bacterium]|nr:hypothetical protein [Myxococcales bacterium]